MVKQQSMIVCGVKSALACAVALIAGAALLASEETAPASATRTTADAGHVGAKGDVEVVRLSAASVRIRAVGPVKNELPALGDMEPHVEDDGDGHAPRSNARSRSLAADGQGGIAGIDVCPNPDPAANCFEPHGGAGCDDEACCEVVCASDVGCCDPNVGWDEACVGLAEKLCEADCTKYITPGAIYSNWHPDCGVSAVIHGQRLLADNLWWGNTGGVLQELSFSVYNGTNNLDHLTAATVEVILSTTIPGLDDGTVDLSTAIAIIDVSIDDLDLPPGNAAVITIVPEGEIVMPAPGINAGTRYLSATFDGDESTIDQLGSRIANPIALGLSHRRHFLEDSGNGVGTNTGVARNFVWEIVTDGNAGPNQVVFDNAPQQQVISGTTGNPVNLGFISGLDSAGNVRWITMPFELGPVPEGDNAWKVTGLFPYMSFSSGSDPNVETINWVVWNRDGDLPPGDMIAQGTVELPILEMYHPLTELSARIRPLPVDLVLEPGEYYLTVFGNGTTPPSAMSWLTNAGNGITLVDDQGSFYWRATNYPAEWVKFRTSGLPLPGQKNPDTVNSAMFFVMGEPFETTPPTPCPGDLTGNGNVGVPDLLALLSCWGPVQPGCELADLTDSGNVGVPDLLALLSNWGPCPE